MLAKLKAGVLMKAFDYENIFEMFLIKFVIYYGTRSSKGFLAGPLLYLDF